MLEMQHTGRVRAEHIAVEGEGDLVRLAEGHRGERLPTARRQGRIEGDPTMRQNAGRNGHDYRPGPECPARGLDGHRLVAPSDS
jgi:hypothetical protein